MAAISSLQIGGVTYDIYAKSAEQAPVGSHELSSHSHFSTYFNGTSANSALTSKSALSAATATKVQMQAKSDNTWYQSLFASTSTSSIWYDSDAKVQYNPSSNTFSATNLYGTTVSGATISGTTVYGNTISAGKLTGTQFILVSASATQANITAGNATDVNNLNNPKIGFWNSAANQKGYLIWTDFNASNLWSAAETAFYGTITDGLVLTSDQMNSIFVSKNLSATNFKAPKISATNLSASTIVGGLDREYTSKTNGTAKVTGDTRWMWVCRLKGVKNNTYQHISILLNNSFWNTQQANSILLTFMYGRNGGQGDTVNVYCDRVSFIQKNSDLEFKYVKNPSDTITSNTVDVYIRVSTAGNAYGHWAAKVLNHGEDLISNLVEWKWLFNQTLPDGAIDIPVGGSVSTHTISSHSDTANFFSGNSARSACSATKAISAQSALTAGLAQTVAMSEWTANSARPITFSHPSANADSLGYDSDFTYNPSSNKLLVKNISSTNITATTFSGNLSGAATKLTTNTVGSNILPIYLDAGTPTQCKGDIGWKREYSGYKEISFDATDTYENFIDSCSCASSFAYKLFGNQLDTTDKTYNSIGRLNLSNAAAIQNGIGISDGYPMFHIVAVRQMGYVDFIESTSNKIIRYRFQKDGKLSTKRSLIVSGDSNAPITAVSAKAAPYIEHNHNYTISANTTAFNVSAGIQLSAGSNINITSAGTKAIGISARNDIANASDKSTYFDGTSALYAKSATSATNAANAGTANVAKTMNLTGEWTSDSNRYVWFGENGTAAEAGWDSTLRFNPNSNTLSVPTVKTTSISGTNISGASKTATIDNLINSAARAIPTVNNKTITITTGASPATASFSTNTADNKTITLGSMALKASGDYIPNSYSSSTASTFSGKAVSAVNATKLYVTEHSTNNTTYYPVWANGAGNSVRDIHTTTAKLQFNPASGRLYISNIVKVGGCSMTWNASTSALDFNF